MLEIGYPGRVVWSLHWRTHSHLMRKKHQTDNINATEGVEENGVYGAWELWVEEEVVKDTTKTATKGHQKKINFWTDHMGKGDIFTRYWTQCLLPFPWSWVKQKCLAPKRFCSRNVRETSPSQNSSWLSSDSGHKFFRVKSHRLFP